MSDKPSRNEDEYFAREDAERIQKLRAQQEAADEARERRTHFMKCPSAAPIFTPKASTAFRSTGVPNCHGVWLDHGELEMLMKHEDPGVLRRVFGDVAASIRKLRATS